MPTASTGLTDEQLQSYRTTGYLLLRGLFRPDEVAGWWRECDRLLALPETTPDNPRSPHRMIGKRETVERLDPVVDLSPMLDALVHDERIVQPVAALLNDTPLLFKDKLIFKLPGMSGYPMHQDWAWWPFAPQDAMLSVQFSIDAATAENGSVELFSGYQSALLSPPGEERNLNADEVAKVNPASGSLMVTQPGDVLIFHALTPHRSGPNASGNSRRSLYITYAAATYGDRYKEYYARQHERIAATRAADVERRRAESRLTPANILRRLVRRLRRT